jgi:hypothetical protein
MPKVKAPSASEKVRKVVAKLPEEVSSAAELAKIATALGAGGKAPGRKFYAVIVYKDQLEFDLSRALTNEEWYDVRLRLSGGLGDVLDDDLEGHLEEISGIPYDAGVGDTY